MKLRCPNENCPNNVDGHLYFSVIAHVTQEWAVDRNGDFIEVRSDCIDVLYRPKVGEDLFLCEECGEEAITED